MKIIRVILFVHLPLLSISCNANEERNVESQISIFSEQSSSLIQQLEIFSNKKNIKGLYSLFGDAMKSQLSKDALEKSLNKAWSIKQIDLINIEDYGRYKALIVNVSEFDQSGIEGKSIKIIFAVEEAGKWKLYNFPFTKSGAPGLVLRTPRCFQN